MTSRFKTLARLGAAVLGAAVFCTAQADTFPDKPVRVITPFSPGNTLDTALRVMSEEFKKSTGQHLLIDNKPGGSGLIAAQAAMQAAPDGYTLLLGGSGLMAINPHVYKTLPYDVERDFRPVSNFLGSALVLAAHPSVPADNLKDFVAWVKANPGKVSFASYTAGNASHFSGVMFNKHAGIDMLHVPFGGTGPATTNLIGGQVNVAFLPLLAVRQHVEAGKLKLLAITSSDRSPIAPDTPTFAESGYPDLTVYTWAGLFAPAATPEALVNKLSAEIRKALQTTQVGDRFKEFAFTPLPSTPAAFGQHVRTDSKKWAEAVAISGLKDSR
ncbi:MAG: tripartite tricarboxylate transporter substrate binding protein [Rhodoferax sp.]|nr:tripartite tricarboxylate transporter substrate binding protein [Rhodoferax sp.]